MHDSNRALERPQLPFAVFDLALRLGADAELTLPAIRLKQTGMMRQKLESDHWTLFHAKQSISLRHCAFEWRAWGGPADIISVTDALEDWAGCLEVKAMGIVPVTSVQPGNELARGELLRYLAELAWAPDAILLNRELRWKVLSATEISVAAGYGERAAELVLRLDSEGRIAEAFATDRPYGVDGAFVPQPWRARMSEYRRHLGRWIPFAGEVAWVLEGQDHLYFQAHVEEWKLGAEKQGIELVAMPLI
jgi:hypothetical protein